MLRQKLVLAVAVGAVSFGSGAAYAATHGASPPAKKPPVRVHSTFRSNVHVPCHNHGAKLTSAQL
ncbi:MAG TPA: hypothetical protein VFJ93_12645 [Gaiellaceae bacterium]|nr:hypothetical protein [Gaiellaceae bacterium]